MLPWLILHACHFTGANDGSTMVHQVVITHCVVFVDGLLVEVVLLVSHVTVHSLEVVFL